MELAELIKTDSMVRDLDEWTARWHQEAPSVRRDGSFAETVQALHRSNFELWHHEDHARDDRAGDAEIARAKRLIDRINQRRNDEIERCDMLLLEALSAKELPNPNAALHSETPGLMLDRLSILTLKLYHTAEEMRRESAPAGHTKRNRDRFSILERQRTDLAMCVDAVWGAIVRGERSFKLYRQLKMYNDPELNPVLYGRRD